MQLLLFNELLPLVLLVDLGLLALILFIFIIFNITSIMTNFAGDIATMKRIRDIVGFENTTDVTLIKFFPAGMNFFLKDGSVRYVAYSELA